jgi:hypothetical protein
MNITVEDFIAKREKLESDLPNYLSALNEAVACLKTNGSIPEEIIRKAIGVRPNFCNSLDFETTFYSNYELEIYKINRENFLNNAIKFKQISEKCPD